MTPSEHPKKLPERNKIAKKNGENSKKIVKAARDWVKATKKKADEADKLAKAMEELQAEITAYEAAYAEIVNAIVKQESDFAKEKDAKKKEKIDKGHAKMNKLADEMITDLNKRFTAGLRDKWNELQTASTIAQISI